jgi:hypothetical protein
MNHADSVLRVQQAPAEDGHGDQQTQKAGPSTQRRLRVGNASVADDDQPTT